MSEPEYRDWTITLPFTVPNGDVDGVFTEALFDAAIEHVAPDTAGMTARADTSQGKVWIIFTLLNRSKDLAKDIAATMRQRIGEAVLSGDEACITAS